MCQERVKVEPLWEMEGLLGPYVCVKVLVGNREGA